MSNTKKMLAIFITLINYIQYWYSINPISKQMTYEKKLFLSTKKMLT